MMLSPDLLDRRALAWLRLVDVAGRPVLQRVLVHGDGIASIRKRDGSIAIIGASGFEDYCSSFLVPSSPVPAAKHFPIDIDPVGSELSPRRFDLPLPRDPDPAKAGDPSSLFRAIEIEMLPGRGTRLTGSACVLRVTVRRKSDSMLVQNALVRAQSEDHQFEARGLTDSKGEATLVFPSLPLSFAGAGANVSASIPARAVVSVDPASVQFNDEVSTPRLVRAAPPFVDPDAPGFAAPDFGSGTEVTIGAGRETPLTLEWAQP